MPTSWRDITPSFLYIYVDYHTMVSLNLISCIRIVFPLLTRNSVRPFPGRESHRVCFLLRCLFAH